MDVGLYQVAIGRIQTLLIVPELYEPPAQSVGSNLVFEVSGPARWIHKTE